MVSCFRAGFRDYPQDIDRLQFGKISETLPSIVDSIAGAAEVSRPMSQENEHIETIRKFSSRGWIVVGVILAYSIVAFVMAFQGRYLDWRAVLFATYGIIGVATVFGLRQDSTLGLYGLMSVGYGIALYSIFGQTSNVALVINTSVGLGLMVYVFRNYEFLFTKVSIRKKVSEPSEKRLSSPDVGRQLRMSAMTEKSANIEKLSYELELEKFHWQKQRAEVENKFLNKYFGIIITAIVSVAAVVVSHQQVIVAREQVVISSTNAKAQTDNEILKNDRQFYFEIAKFLLDRRQELTTREIDKVVYLRTVVMTAFPKNVAMQIATNMRDAATNNENRRIWGEAVRMIGDR